jgi:hypothetical protein
MTRSEDHPSEALKTQLRRAQDAAQGKRMGEAAGICNDILAVHPDHPAALAMLGTFLAAKGDLIRSIPFLERAVEQAGSNAAWRDTLSATYRLTSRPEDALRESREAVRLNRTEPRFLLNLAMALTDLGRREEAIEVLVYAIGRANDNASLHLALGQILLARGEFQPGWREYEWRNQIPAALGRLPQMSSAPWNGMILPKGRLLLVCDQGFGDSIQFTRYIPMAAERCAEVILICSPPLESLFAGIPSVGQCRTRWTDVPPHAAHCLLSSLPRIFQTEHDTIPRHVPYLTPDPARVAAWRKRLDASVAPGSRRVGLAWSGRPSHPNNIRRSMRLEILTPLAGMPNIQFVSLQKPFPAADRALVDQFPGLEDFSESLTDFGESAALIATLDLVITVDTAVAHLTGALGCAVWVMLPKTADWRWLLERDDNPWYPSARLFRQQRPGAWDQVVAQIVAALGSEAHPGASKTPSDRGNGLKTKC